MLSVSCAKFQNQLRWKVAQNNNVRCLKTVFVWNQTGWCVGKVKKDLVCHFWTDNSATYKNVEQKETKTDLM